MRHPYNAKFMKLSGKQENLYFDSHTKIYNIIIKHICSIYDLRELITTD